ncbi:MAG: hypothetical protein FWG33_02740 [Oscillospiraceae bacterium]|nr:hypothetical protein [Oscillospiraceae bacterium]
MKKTLKISALSALGLAFTGCRYTPNSFGTGWNVFITILGIAAGLLLLFFIIYGIVSSIYKGKDVTVKVLKKKEANVLRGNMMGRSSPGYKGQTDLSRKARRQKGRLRYSKVIVELDGQTKTLKCNDNVLLDKLMVGKKNNIRIKFGEIVKILK